MRRAIRPQKQPKQATQAAFHAASGGRRGVAVAPPPYGIAILDEAADRTGLPEGLKASIEGLSGVSMRDVKVHYDSPRPAQLRALAYTEGANIHVAPGQERHLAHEAWHVVQQAQGRVAPTMRLAGVPMNDDLGLEQEAQAMGDRASRAAEGRLTLQETIGIGPAVPAQAAVVQLLKGDDYSNTHINANGRSDRENVRDGIVAALRANLAGMDWSEYWGHIGDHNHNTANPVGNSSTFRNDTQARIRGYIESVLNHYTPYFNTDRLVFDSTTGGVCNGSHRDGSRTNVRVIVRVADVTDEQLFTEQVGSMVVENAYPIA